MKKVKADRDLDQLKKEVEMVRDLELLEIL